jgi:hypothetical protein
MVRQFNLRNDCSMSSQANSCTQARLDMFQLAFAWATKWAIQSKAAEEVVVLSGSDDKVTSVCEFLRKKFITKVGHPPYSPDLAPCDFWLFPKLKKCPDGTKICWHSMQCDVTARYSGKRFSRLFLAVAPWSYNVHSFTGPFRELNCRTSYMHLMTVLVLFDTKHEILLGKCWIKESDKKN